MNDVPLVIRYGTLHHQGAGEPLRNGVLVIEGERITAVGSSESDLPLGAEVIEAACVVPGLINAHAHLEMCGEAQTEQHFKLTTPTQRALACADNARGTLEAGVTTIRDVGSSDSLAADTRDAINAGRLAGPNVLAAGRVICMTGGHGWFVGRQVDGPWDARKAVREQRRDGADCIKFIATGGVLTKGAVPGVAQLLEDELRAGIEEAHAHGMRCAAHAIGTEGIKNAVRAGIDSIEHGHLIDDEGIALMLEHGTYLVPTLSAPRCILDAGPEAGIPDYVLRKAGELGAELQRNLVRAREAGVRFAGGSDAGTPFNTHRDYAFEVELMQSILGMDVREALYATTVNGAQLLGIERGRLEVGQVADLLLLERQLESDARPLREPLVVVKSGAVAIDRRARR